MRTTCSSYCTGAASPGPARRDQRQSPTARLHTRAVIFLPPSAPAGPPPVRGGPPDPDPGGVAALHFLGGLA